MHRHLDVPVPTLLTFGPALSVWTWPSAAQLALLVLIGAVATVGHLAMAKALQLADATVVLPLDFTRLIWAGAIGLLAFGEIPDLWTVVGALLIAASAAYITYRESRLKRRAREEGGSERASAAMAENYVGLPF